MSSLKPIPTSLFFLLIIFSMTSSKLSYCINFCPKIEKQSLLSFKQSLKDPSNKLSSWNINGEVNCCKWKGVVCNNYTGHVHQLHLQNCELHGKLNPSLLNLRHLIYLNLSLNYFSQTIPSFIGSFPALEYLDLSAVNFYGTIPHTIGNLSNLRILSMEGLDQSNVDNLEWLSGLSQLENLNMNHVNLSKASTNWMHVINKLSYLVELCFSNCSLNFIGPMNDVVNVSSLAVIDLSNNRLQSFAVLKWIFQLSTLNHLDLSGNEFEGPIPSISNVTKLQYIDLSDNYLNSTIPDWLYFCKDLQIVILTINSLHNSISNAIANLSSLNYLDLSNNELFGGIPEEIGIVSSLRYLHLENNKLTGNLPQSLGKLFNLESLHFGGNMLEGEVNESHFVNLTKLKYFYASGNHLILKVNPNWIPPFKLFGLNLNSWNLGGVGTHIPSWLETQKNIDILHLSSTGISGQVPSWFWGIMRLNISHNHLCGKIPHIGGVIINLSSNQFIGSLPQVANTVVWLDLSNNSFSGDLSHYICDMSNEIYGMKILNLERNQLTGELPDCWMKWPSLIVLNLGYNNISGSIPNSIGFLADLMSLNLRNNNISNQIPASIHNCTKLAKIDLAKNNLDGNMPTWMGATLPNLRILILRSNKLSGNLSPDICQLKSLQILDLSHNKFSGIIPRCVDNFTTMATSRRLAKFGKRETDYNIREWKVYSPREGTNYTFDLIIEESATVSTKGRETEYGTILSLFTSIDLSDNYFFGNIPKELTSLVELRSLNLSGNHLTGLIPERIGEMKQLESLDLSRNSICGEIPNSFTLMSSLSDLNLSYNNLMGRIPESTQILGFDDSSFTGNNLCGPPLTRNCSNDDEIPRTKNKEDNEGNKSEIDWFYIFLSLGYAVGFSVVCTTLILKKSWRVACFWLLEDVWNKAYVYSYIKWRRFVGRSDEAQ